MKRLLRYVAFLLLVCVSNGFAQLTYDVNGGAIAISGYSGTGGGVIIPATIDDLPVTSIEAYAFYFSSFTNVSIPASVTNIGEAAFSYCYYLTAVTVASANPDYSSSGGILFNNNQTALVQTPSGLSGAYSIPGSVTNIGDYAFAGSELSSVTIPDSVASIGDYAFADASITNLAVPGSVTSIGSEVFNSCLNLMTINVVSSNPDYSSVDGVLFNKDQTILISFPGAPGGTYTIPSTVTSIAGAAFESDDLTNITVPASVASIDAEAFSYCRYLESITVATSNPDYSSAGGVLFNKSQAILIAYPGSLTGDYVVPGSVTNIGAYAFSGDTMHGVTLPAGLISIGDYAFDDDYITSIAIPATVTGIGYASFDYCDLSTVTIPASVTNIGDYAFNDCYNLQAITVNASNPDYSSADGVLFDKNLSTLIQYPGGLANAYTVPENVSIIETGAFAYCNLTNVLIPASVTNIGDYSFEYCSKLSAVNFLGNAPALGGGDVFEGDSATVYYEAGTTGWGSTYGSLNTSAVNSSGPFAHITGVGVQNNEFGFTINGSSHLVVMVEACTNLAKPIWSPMATNTLTGGSSHFSDPQWTSYQGRFYRVVSP